MTKTRNNANWHKGKVEATSIRQNMRIFNHVANISDTEASALCAPEKANKFPPNIFWCNTACNLRGRSSLKKEQVIAERLMVFVNEFP